MLHAYEHERMVQRHAGFLTMFFFNVLEKHTLKINVRMPWIQTHEDRKLGYLPMNQHSYRYWHISKFCYL